MSNSIYFLLLPTLVISKIQSPIYCRCHSPPAPEEVRKPSQQGELGSYTVSSSSLCFQYCVRLHSVRLRFLHLQFTEVIRSTAVPGVVLVLDVGSLRTSPQA